MAGVKGRSGRKSNSNEEYRLETIEECWKLVREAITNESLPYSVRVELAAKHTVKSIPTELAGSVDAHIVAMGTIEMDGKKADFRIGSDPSEDTQPTA